MGKRVDLLQGTLDLLYSKPFHLAHCTGTESCCVSSRFPGTACISSKVRFIRPSIGWSTKAGLKVNGANRRTIAKPNSIV